MTRWTDPLSKHYQLRGKGSKHTAAQPQKATEPGGKGYRSKLELSVHAALLYMEKAGLIQNIRREQTIQITPSISHRIDFIFFDVKRNTDIGCEAKGRVFPGFEYQRKAYRDFTKIPIQIWIDLGGGRVGVKEEIPVGKYRIELIK